MACPRGAALAARSASQEPPPHLEVADVFRAHGEDYVRHHRLTPDQLAVMRDIVACRTENLGGHLDVCPDCGTQRPSYNSCRNRHCPKCQATAAAKWLEERMQHLLPVTYFHVVFTLPAELRALCRRNPAPLYHLLFTAASCTLLDLGRDPKRLGAQLGFSAILHTWTRTLEYHPHLHCVVTGGGLNAAGDQWISTPDNYLFPVEVMGPLLRGKFLDGLRRLYQAGELAFGRSCAELQDSSCFGDFLDRRYRQNWLVYAKPPFAGPEHVYRYLGRYTHRTGISNQRLLAFDHRGVTFATKNGETITLGADEFIRRFLQHVLPGGFTKVRHFGLMAPCHVKGRLGIARRVLAPPAPSEVIPQALANQPMTSGQVASPPTTLAPLPSEASSQPPANESTTRNEPLPAPTALGPPQPTLQATPREPLTWDQRVLARTGLDPLLCPVCGGRLRRRLQSIPRRFNPFPRPDTS